ncbi:MAG TPA: 3-hydroxyacyl-CoA dehydrogenase NAD-binding domain-containing protein [Coxiellaceae bacterium]|nr:3-hydroxyacyl-CoA dehydrogenase NAD-binding domain-containing protein [Coxiellaceae bacterium]
MISTHHDYKNWEYHLDEQNIAWLSFNRQEASANSLDVASLEELAQILAELKEHPPAGLVIQSAKENGFIMGADVKQFTELKDPEEAYQILRKGQIVFAELEGLAFPTVALIRGFCLGGGLELALACRYRVVEDCPKVRLGFPEIKLGIHPGWGGTVRLPPLVGMPKALELILQTRLLSAKEAYRCGLVTTAQPARELHRAVIYYLTQQPKLPGSNWASFSLALKPLLVPYVRRQLKKKVDPKHYPAPYAALDLYQGGAGDSYEAEARSVAKLMLTPTCRELVRVFFLRDQLKSQAQIKSSTIRYVHVVGAGTMGGDIAAWCVLRGFQVSLQDREPKFIAPAIKRATALFKKHLKQEHLVEEALSRLLPDIEGHGLKRADLVIEAIIENLEAKQSLFKDIESKVKPACILATNTSSITLKDIAQVLKDPGRLLGLHFFNPVAHMPLVEVVHYDKTHPQLIDQAINFVQKIDRLPAKVKSSPGFLVNRILMPYLLEAMLMFEEGFGVNEIDKAAVQFGMPMGPLALADKVGLDICLAVAENLSKYLDRPLPGRLREWVQAGRLGCKSGWGFYKYNKAGKIIKQKDNTASHSATEITDRLILALVNEAAACIREEIIASSDLLDAAVIFGTGFAPFRGGPLEYAHQRGIDDIIKRLKELSAQYGKRFTPDSEWSKLR